ncbi:MAG: hypothetical protein HC845_15485 [Akkermansiaceae bacterium]|nr:hypothetical protein [Akkermansiaceae bacterium]
MAQFRRPGWAANIVVVPPPIPAITGTVYREFNGNGTRQTANPIEPGVAGVTVTVYNATGAVAGTAVSSATGAYSITPTGAAPYRVEFTNVPAPFQPSLFGAGNATAVQFLPSSSAMANFAVTQPGDYCDTTNPPVLVACYEPGNAVYGATGNTGKGLIRFPYNSSGGTPSGISGLSNIHELGTVWGMGWQAARQRAFSTAFLKRHSGFGPQGIGGVYVLNPFGSPAVTSSFNLQGVTPVNGGAAIDLGSVTRTGSANFTLPNSTGDSIDLDAFAKVGKVSFGDADVSEDLNTLWMVNLNQRALISVDVSGATVPGAVRQFLLSTFTGLPAAPNGVLRPWGLAFANGRGYLGVVSSGELVGGTVNDMTAYVLSFDPAAVAAYDYSSPGVAPALTTEISFPLNYNRETGVWNGGPGPVKWKRWTDTWAGTGLGTALSASSEREFAQPILSDIEFTEKGDMVLGFTDRFAVQTAFQNFIPVAGTSVQFSSDSAGDIIHVCRTATGWALEGSAACPEGDNSTTLTSSNLADGPGGTGEFYWADRFNDPGASPLWNHNETTLGGLSIVPGTGEVMSTSYDPVDGSFAFDQGFTFFNTTTGGKADAFTVVNGVAGGTKALGLGDPIVLCKPSPIQIGNRVWNDVNSNGIQDPTEVGIAGVTVSLKNAGGTTISTAITDSNGNYYFSSGPGTNTASAKYNIAGLTYFTNGYTVSVSTTDPVLAGKQTTLANADASANGDQRDSDATVSAGAASVTFNTSGLAANNHTYDIGFSPANPALGNLVFLDANADGIRTPNGVDNIPNTADDETGIPGVVVSLFAADGTTTIDDPNQPGVQPYTVTTDSNGSYNFINLTVGSYVVKILTPPTSTPNSSPAGVTDTADNQQDNDDNGIQATPGGQISSPVIALGAAEADETIDLVSHLQPVQDWATWYFAMIIMMASVI